MGQLFHSPQVYIFVTVSSNTEPKFTCCSTTAQSLSLHDDLL